MDTNQLAKTIWRIMDDVKASHLADNEADTVQDIVTERLADFCESQDRNFDRALWLVYVAGESNGLQAAERKGRK